MCISPYSEGSLTGLSFAVKDNIDLANEMTGNGSPNWKAMHPKPAANAICVEQLLSAGATCNGKAQLTEIWNTFGSWVENDNPQVSPDVAHKLRNFPKNASRSDILNTLYQTHTFSKNIFRYLSGNKILCFPTTIDLAPKLSDVTPEFLATGDYYPRTMGVTAISGLSRLPEITVPFVKCNGVPIGVSFVAGYGNDLLLAEICNLLGMRTLE